MTKEIKIINFMGQRKVAAMFSLLLLLGSIASLAINGLQFGLDFTGGTQVEVGYEQPADLNAVRRVLKEEGLENSVAVFFGSDTDVLVRTQGSLQDIAFTAITAEITRQAPGAIVTIEKTVDKDKGDFSTQLNVENAAGANLAALFPASIYGAVKLEQEGNTSLVLTENSLGEAFTANLVQALAADANTGVELRRSEFVGPQVGEELRDDGGLGMLFALAVVMVYVAMRFQMKFSVGAVAALAHDVVIVLGAFSILKLDFDLTVLAAVLAVIGYSLNDTIVVSDRIRENFRKLRKADALEVINMSLSQTLGRTMVTSFTTMLVLLALFFVGGELIHGFATALIIGIVVGTYSSIYVAANVLLLMGVTKEDLMEPVKEGAELDDMP